MLSFTIVLLFVLACVFAAGAIELAVAERRYHAPPTYIERLRTMQRLALTEAAIRREATRRLLRTLNRLFLDVL